MRIKVNGEEKETVSLFVSQLLEELSIDPRPVAIEYNREILPKKDYQTTILNDGDQLEIVWFVSGGDSVKSFMKSWE
jgi:sulfur carrier protein